MPCNDQQSLSIEGTSGGGVIDANANVYPSSSENINSEFSSAFEDQHANQCNLNANLPSESPNRSNRVRSSSCRTSTTPNLHYSFAALHPLPGEELGTDSWVDMESGRLFLTQYRIVVVAHNQNAMCSIPLAAVDLLEAKDIVGLQTSCKDGRIIKLRAENSETACNWYKKLVQKTCIPRDLENFFAFQFYTEGKKKLPSWLRREQRRISAFDQVEQEFRRLKLNEGNWRISSVNCVFEVCPTYPQHLIVPASVTNEDLKQMSFGRYYRRFPTLVWHNVKNGAVLLRSSQPSIGFFGMVNDRDVTLYEKILAAISTDKSSKILIVDARSYTAAWANRAKGGGFEAADTYTNAEIVFMGLPNIHNIRYSFHQLRQLLNSNADPNIYLQSLQSTQWLQNIGQLFTATERCLNALCEGTSVLVHCSDGWDRTTQIVSLCMLIVDPYYRTLKGFEMLIQRQWVEFGHKFADRGGVLNTDDNEKSPVFLQFLDCVYQLWEKNSDKFQFNRRYLMKLVQHTFSGLFGTFLFNSIKEAADLGCDPNDPDLQKQRCFQVWDYLGEHNKEFNNPAYNKRSGGMLCYPRIVPELLLWRDAYCCTSIQSLINNPDIALQHCYGTGSTQDISSEKPSNTLSRSQSAASLTSLDQNSTIQSAHSGSTFMNLTFANGTNSGVSHLNTKLGESCSVTSIPNVDLQSHKYMDVDGLSKVPEQLEDQVRARIEEWEKVQKTFSQNTPLRDGFINGRAIYATDCNSSSKRVSRQRIDSETTNSYVIVNGADGSDRAKHNSSSSLVGTCLPSSYSSTGTIDEFTQNGFGCKNSILQEGIETADEDGLEMIR